MIHDLLLFAHVIGACVLLGTGAGIAFFMVVSQRSQNPDLIAHVAGIVVLADWVFTATAAIAQPITGYFLALAAGWPLTSGWVAGALCCRWRVLVACGVDTKTIVLSGPRRRGPIHAPVPALSPPISHLVRLRISRLCRRAGHPLADDQQTSDLGARLIPAPPMYE